MVRSFSSHDGLVASVDCSDWEDFRRVSREMLRNFSGLSELGDRYIFRGQSCSSWNLESSFDRNHSGLSPADRDLKYAEQIRLFRENYSVYGDIGRSNFSENIGNISELDEKIVEAVAQHYGLSTRLIDWSLSMYVSAFFSFSRVDLCTSGKASIWCLDTAFLSKFSKSEIDIYRDFYRGNIRNLWQMGIFLRNFTSNNDIIYLFSSKSRSYDHRLDAGPPALIRFDFPIACEAEVLDDLQMMRINSMTIFPGIEGVVNWIRRRS